MKLVDTSQVCPYTGLRAFTEDESLYFKGRDEQVDQVTAQLEERKFLMLTGASGEGKSSLIYAGLIPNARAGFFKARYTNWKVIDFRPERSPIKNMSRALSQGFGINEGTIETEMRRGFSSLIDIYLNSDCYINEEEDSFKSLSDSEKKSKKRNGSNLLILVDQFEEFFTNPENYYNQSPSEDSQIVVNLILETARIALQQKLPIYLVCTMRSDYIGQCSSFRGLAEYIGYSQFFVPRLKRKEMKQVIEEPAILSGNRISQRLADRLVYDLSEGVDQLPILQHALSQIWVIADHGMEEMDLIHYAMVGGMPSTELPPEDKLRFEAWFTDLPEYQKKFYEETGLGKVIENHASRLYESAASYYNSTNPDSPIAARDAKHIIALAFSCLTRIDNSRAVRNRMTLAEISAIINRPELTPAIIGKVLDIYREDENAFVRPFKGSGSEELKPETVLDITHESLIRNWRRLNKWAANEFDFYTTFLDLKKQLQRWKQNGKSSGYLLPIGPLTYFENWYQLCRPNVGWINRYAERSSDPTTTLKESESLLNDLNEYLRKSAAHVRVSRAFVKYGAGSIALLVSFVVLLGLCGWYLYDAAQKTNENVVKEIRLTAIPLINSNEVGDQPKSWYLLAEESLEKGSAIRHLNDIGDRNARIPISVRAYREMLVITKRSTGPLKDQLIGLINADLKTANTKSANLLFELENRNDYIYALAFDSYYNPDSPAKAALGLQCKALYGMINQFFSDDALRHAGTTIEINQSIQHWLAFGNPSATEITSVLNLISPFAGATGKSLFEVLYPKRSYQPNGLRPLDFGGGFHMLACLYAAAGDKDKLDLCLQQLGAQSDYYSGKLFNDYTNVIGFLYQYGHRDLVSSVVGQVQTYFPQNTPEVVYKDVISKSGYIAELYRINMLSVEGGRSLNEEGTIDINLCFSDRAQFQLVVDDYEKLISGVNDESERNFLQAVNKKRIAIYEQKYSSDRGIPLSQSQVTEMFDAAWSHFLKVSESYLSASMTYEYYEMTRVQSVNVTRREYFVYPDYIGGWQSAEYHSDIFYKYLEKKKLLLQAYREPRELEQIHVWLGHADKIMPFMSERSVANKQTISDSTIRSVLSMISRNPSGQSFDTNLPYLILSDRAFERGDTTSGLEAYKKINLNTIRQSRNLYALSHKTRFRNRMKSVAQALAVNKKINESRQLIELFETAFMKLCVYADVSNAVYQNNYDPKAFVFLDSAFAKWGRLPNPTVPPFVEYRTRILQVVETIGGVKMKKLADDIRRNMPEQRILQTHLALTRALVHNGDYYGAMTSISPILTETQDLICKTTIIGAAANQPTEKSDQDLRASLRRHFALFESYIPFIGLTL